MIISFGWTSPALVAHALYEPPAAPIKTVTRREWTDHHAAQFKAGQEIDAWNTSPRNFRNHPHKIATIRLTEDPYLEMSSDVPLEDWYREGFQWLTDHGQRVGKHTPEALWRYWSKMPTTFYVVRFEVVGVHDVKPALVVVARDEIGRPYVRPTAPRSVWPTYTTPTITHDAPRPPTTAP